MKISAISSETREMSSRGIFPEALPLLSPGPVTDSWDQDIGPIVVPPTKHPIQEKRRDNKATLRNGLLVMVFHRLIILYV